MQNSQPELNLSNPDQPRIVTCNGNTFHETCDWITKSGGHIEQYKWGPHNADYSLTVNWPSIPRPLPLQAFDTQYHHPATPKT